MRETAKIVIRTPGQESDGSFAYVSQGRSITVGRYTGGGESDLSVYNQLISKRHCRIHYDAQRQLWVEDLDSKNGTELNGQRLVPYEKYPFAEGDILTMVNGLIQLRTEGDLEETREYRISDLLGEGIRVHDHLQTVQIGEVEIPLSKKEFQLFKLLYSQLDHFVTREQIVGQVWPERSMLESDSVGIDEINSLIYRTNRKLGVHFTIKSVYKKGVYMKSHVPGVMGGMM
ncbi:FHA domain-containing protein [Paenibacillus sp. ACRRY]|uniref:FHA domain-containing protein n=1 Tax=Paenibacillus sp. ACRRY TaxID=2918208 RepID=UPI001EF7506D|nr:FHA domain-containing protein [Paenibacillus sp. ACRRY]MCG7383751.1 FHA domain-containing protein [Paenibacillus sp. ACRRY]